MPLYHSGPGGTSCVHTTVGWCSTVLLRVLGPASGVCYSTGPEFPELCTGTPVFDWGGRGACSSSLNLSFVICVYCGVVGGNPLTTMAKSLVSHAS